MSDTIAVTSGLPDHNVRLGGLATPKTKASVKNWAVVGAVLYIFQIWVLVKWIAGPYFRTVPSGPVPEAMKIAYWALVVVSWVTAVLITWFWVVRPRRRTGTYTPEGMLVIWCFVSGWFWDPFSNFMQQMYVWSSVGPNRGSWIAEIPGFHGIGVGHPGAMMAYPLMLIAPLYGLGASILAIIALISMRWAQRQFPNLGGFGLVMVGTLVGGFVDTVFEIGFLRSGLYAYVSGIRSVTLWPDHYYRFPLYEFVFAGIWCSGYAALMFFKNDRGETLVERGLSRLTIGRGNAAVLRYLAFAAGFTGLFFLTYFLPCWIVTQYDGAWPRDIQQRPYLTNYICGPGTNQTCSSNTLPLPHRGPIVHFDPNGKLIVPPGVPQPGSESVTTSGG